MIVEIGTFQGHTSIRADLTEVKETIVTVALIMAGNTEIIKQEQESLTAKRERSEKRRRVSLQRPYRGTKLVSEEP